MIGRSFRSLLDRLRRDASAIAMVEFALSLPLLLGVMLSGLEIANYVLTDNKIQRLSTMMADLLAQNGEGQIAATEAQVYDLFTALDVSAKPYDVRGSGRVILTVLKGVKQSDGTVANKFLNQQFDGALVSATPLLGCNTTNPTPVYARALTQDEVVVHAQVSYTYAPLFSQRVYDLLNLPRVMTRTAAFRARSKDFNVTPDANHPNKGNCATANGL